MIGEIAGSCLLSTALLVGEPPNDNTSREIRVLMGTLAEIQVTSEGDPSRAIASAFARISEVEAALSRWVETSEIARLNQERETTLSPDAFAAVKIALEVAKASGGAFDPTLIPNGYARVELDPQSLRVSLPLEMKLDLDAIAKGCAVDGALAELKRSVTRGLVDLGTSSIALFGKEPVTFEVRDPDGGPPPATFRLNEGAIASSGRDQKGNHILDPRTGKSPTEVRTATVVGPSAAEADALSTAVFAMGADAGLALVEQRGAEGLVLLSGSSGYVVRATPGFVERYALEVADGVEMEVSSAMERR